MFEELRIFLVDNASPESFDLIDEAFEIFDDIYSVEIQNYYQGILFTQDESLTDTGDTLVRIISLTRSLLIRILTEHQISVNEDITLNRLIKIIKALIDIQQYEDIDSIVSILNLELDNEERLSEILSLVCEMDSSEIILELEDVSDGFINNLKEFTKLTPRDIYIEQQPDGNEYLEKIKQFKEFVKTPLKIFELLSSGLKPGYPFEIYINTIGNQLEALDAKDASRELLAMTLISIDGRSNPKSKIKEYIEKYISDFRMITKIDIELTNLLLEYQVWLDNIKSKSTEYTDI